MITRVLLSIFIFFYTSIGFSSLLYAVGDLNVRVSPIGDTGHQNTMLENFANQFSGYFIAPGSYGSDGVTGTFMNIAYNIKNFFIAIAVIFLITAVIKLLFSASDEENVKKLKSTIIWTSVGIIIMQIAYSVWNTLILKTQSSMIGSSFGWDFWIKIFEPIVNLMQITAIFGFILMAVTAFFNMVSAGGDEEKAKKAKSTILYAFVGLLLIRIPYALIKSFYGRPGCENTTGGFLSIGSCDIKEANLSGGIALIGKVFVFFNTFLTVICVLLIIYSGWLVFLSGGDEEKIKKAKHTVVYIVLGFIVLVASHAIFRFFILKG